MTTFYERPCPLCGGPAEYCIAGAGVMCFRCEGCGRFSVDESTADRLQGPARARLRASLAEKVRINATGKVGVISWPPGEQLPVVRSMDWAVAPRCDG